MFGVAIVETLLALLVLVLVLVLGLGLGLVLALADVCVGAPVCEVRKPFGFACDVVVVDVFATIGGCLFFPSVSCTISIGCD